MKVKIIKAEKPTYWYASKVGEVFEVEVSNFDSDFRLATKQHLFISAKDCEVVNTLQAELEAAKNLVAELEKKIAEEAAIEAAKPFTKEQYEKVVAEYRACAGRKKFVHNERNYCLVCFSEGFSIDFYENTPSASLFGAWFINSQSCCNAKEKVGTENLKKAMEYEMNIGLEGK